MGRRTPGIGRDITLDDRLREAMADAAERGDMPVTTRQFAVLADAAASVVRRYAPAVLADVPAVAPLTVRQTQVLRGLACGQSYDDIARALEIRKNTVKTIAGHLYAALGAEGKAHAVAIGYETGLLPAAVEPSTARGAGTAAGRR